METFFALLEAALNLVPLVAVAAPLIALLIDLGKRFKWIGDGNAGMWSLILNAAFWVGLHFAAQSGVEKPATDLIVAVAAFAPVVVAFVLALVTANSVHKLAAKRGFGYSYPK